jgi:hypothetical protein
VRREDAHVGAGSRVCSDASGMAALKRGRASDAGATSNVACRVGSHAGPPRGAGRVSLPQWDVGYGVT